MGVFALKQTAPVTETAEASEQVSSEPVEPVSTAAGCWDGRDGFVHSGRLLITHLVVVHGFCQLFLGLQSLIKQFCSSGSVSFHFLITVWVLCSECYGMFNKTHVRE